MVTRPLRPAGWTPRHLRYIAGIFRPGRNSAARVYESIGADSFLAPAPGWLNLGFWDHADDYPPTKAELFQLYEKLAEFAESWEGPILFPELPAMSHAAAVLTNALAASGLSPAEQRQAATAAARLQRALARR